jgi:nitroreductase
MEFQQVVQKRRMVRAFREDPLAKEVVERILTNGNRAPSAGFTQGYGFLVLEAAEDRACFWETMTAVGHPPEPAGDGRAPAGCPAGLQGRLPGSLR